MLNVDPLMSMSAFIIDFIVVLLAMRAGVDIYIYYSEQKKSQPSVGAQGRQNRTNSKAVQRYYNKNIKGA